ncbi:unnamed protein product [Lupinus luteus]|uniref:Uncharacterized protein n=1 Tax=Lupinus luteus TaxID=3873 RepID=A0AAV1VSD5_LUPLU
MYYWFLAWDETPNCTRWAWIHPLAHSHVQQRKVQGTLLMPSMHTPNTHTISLWSHVTVINIKLRGFNSGQRNNRN